MHGSPRPGTSCSNAKMSEIFLTLVLHDAIPSLWHNDSPMINEETVEKACSQVAEYTDEDMVAEFDRFFQAQPAICEFIVELTHESGQKIQELSLFLSYMVFKTLEFSDEGVTASLKPEDIESA